MTNARTVRSNTTSKVVNELCNHIPLYQLRMSGPQTKISWPKFAYSRVCGADAACSKAVLETTKSKTLLVVCTCMGLALLNERTSIRKENAPDCDAVWHARSWACSANACGIKGLGAEAHSCYHILMVIQWARKEKYSLGRC